MAHFQTKYGIGDVLYAPRCYERRVQDRLEVDDKIYTHTRTIFDAVVKKKIVSAIFATVANDGNVIARYQLNGELMSNAPEAYLDRMHPNVEAARLIAEQYEKAQQVYHGA